jgi:membrane fusion protein, copper/silver efflux system
MAEESKAPPPPPRSGFGLGTVIFISLFSAALAATAVLYLTHREKPASTQTAPAPDPRGVLYTCPMHPQIIQDHPGNCPLCGMKLVLAERSSQPTPDAARGARGLLAVDIDPARQQLIGMRTAKVTRGPVGIAWRTSGKVAIDETRVRHVNLKIGGFVERVYVDFVGRPVKKGEPLFSIYSPDLLAAQEEYLLALKTQGQLARAGSGLTGDGEALVAAARRKLSLWDVPEEELERLRTSREPLKNLTFRSPVSGVVTKKDVVDGMKLEAGAMPYEIVDLSSVWVLADVYETELGQVTVGLAASLRLKAFPNREFKGKVVFIDPVLDPRSRTVKVRLTFPNPTGELKPEMFGEVVLETPRREGLRIPPDAVIDSGTEKIVFVALGNGKFQPRKVKVGEGDEAQLEVVAGLDEGEQVVTRANFLVDSESRLRASLGELGQAPSADAGAPAHLGHEHRP